MITAAHRVIHHPYVYAGVAIARVTVCIATLLWGVIVLYQPIALSDFLGSTMSGFRIGQPFHSLLGATAILLSVYQLFCTVKWCPQTLLSEAVSFFMVVLWTLATIAIWGDSPVPATGAACTTAVMILSWWNLVAPPKHCP